MQSALGQPLRAEVEITSLTRDEAGSLSARLAAPDAFRQAGLEFNPALNSLRFAVDRRADGRSVVRITSAQPINEPFVDLLVELNWAAGKFVREYTFLLDPPELRIAGRDTVEGGNSRQQALVPPAAAAASAPAVAVVPAQPAPAAAPLPNPAPQAQARPQPAARPATRPTPAAAPASIEVKPGDTLNAIATRVKPEGVSLEQALIAFYQKNPSAFFGSVHQLKSGSTLAVPDKQAMAAVDQAQASEQLRVHTRDFNEYRSRLAEGARTVAPTRAGQSVEGSVTARVEDKAAPTASRDQLRLSKSDPAAASSGAAGATGSAASKAGAAAEQNVAREAAMREAQSRVSELEKNVNDLQRLLELKNRQLAELQKQVDEAKAAGKTAAGTVAKAEPAAAPAVQEQKPAASSAPAPAVVEPPRTEAAPVAVAPAETPKAEPAASEPKPADAKPADAKPSAVASAPAPEAGFADDLLSNPLMLPGLGAILALGAGYGWYAMRRRRKVEKFEDSLIAAEGFATNSLFGSTGGQNVDTSSSVFSSSTKDSGVDVHSTEVDPIAEAEVYIAYGREAQAEEILKEALKRQPERQAIRAKLLEIYSGRKDVPAFNLVAGEMHQMTGGQNEDWAKVVTMGLALDPDNPLYTGRAPAQPEMDRQVDEAASAQALADDEPLARPDSPEPEAVDFAAENVSEPKADEPAVDFGALDETAVSFEETRPFADEAANRKADSSDEVPSLDFDLDLDTTIGRAGDELAASRDGGSGSNTELERAVEGRFELPSLDLQGSSGSEREPDDSEIAVSGLDDLNIDLPALESLTRTGASKSDNTSPAPGDDGLDLSAIGLDLEPSGGSAPVSGDGMKWQEMATKLDLASAYEEIGDKEGARELLEEVVKGGDGDQQRKARSMLAKIG